MFNPRGRQVLDFEPGLRALSVHNSHRANDCSGFGIAQANSIEVRPDLSRAIATDGEMFSFGQSSRLSYFQRSS
jgi:hypothetical protein